MNEQRISILVERYFDRELSADETTELQALLRENAVARERFWEAAEWQALFRQWGEQEWGREAANAERRVVAMPAASRTAKGPAQRPRVARMDAKKVVRFPIVRWAAGLAAAAAVVTLALVIHSRAPVATLAQVDGAVWSSAAVDLGARLKPGRLRLEKGAAVIAFDRGARVVLEGPADFEVLGRNASVLRFGKLRAQVPTSAHGFKVETPQFTAVDIGTEFGCDLALNGTGELHVFVGKVDMKNGDARSAATQLSENQAMRIARGVTTPITAQPYSFLSENELARRELARKGDALGAWRMASRQLDEHPATVMHLDFEGGSDAAVPNRARRAPPNSNATVVGCKPAEGRWPGKRALAFQREEDRLAVALPGQFESLTLLAWLRVESLHARHNSLLMGHSFRAGEVHWYLYGDGTLGLGILPTTPAAEGGWRTFLSLPAVGPQNLGSWIFVATVFDGATGAVTHYLNGEPVGSKVLGVRVPLQLAVADIGNRAERLSDPEWAKTKPRKPGDAPGNFNGRIDELAVLSTPLGAEEIRRLFQQGKPGVR